MLTFLRKRNSFLLLLFILTLMSLACKTGTPHEPNEPTTQSPEVVLQRLSVAFLGQDGHKIIGSGCPGSYEQGKIMDYHLVVGGVDENKRVERVLVAGDNSTLTWESPCNKDWALVAENLGSGNWEIFIAPSLPSKTYTVMFFYDDATFALGVGTVP